MKKILLSTILLSFLCFDAFAEWISQGQAMDTARKFFAENGLVTASGVNSLKQVWPRQTKSAAEASPLYIFNRERGGFVLVSGSNKTLPVLGYSFDSSFIAEAIPDNVKWWIEGYESIVADAERDVSISSMSAWTFDSSEAFEYNTALWGQDAPFNGYCPSKSGNHCVTGCSNTAMAIIMRYHKWPVAGHGSVPGYTTGGLTIEGRELGYEYDWDSMPLEYDEGKYSEYQAQQVARIMADLGLMHRSNYTVYSTGTNNTNIPPAVAEYMDYDGSVELVFAGEYKASDWADLVLKELKEDGPVFMGGSGHAFVVDGYDGEGFYHFNFGWNGNSNGYFTMVVIPGHEDKINQYRSSQHMLINLRPDRSRYINLTLQGGPMYFNWDYSEGKSFTVKCDLQITNSAYYDYNGEICVAMVSKDGVIKELVSDPQHISLAPESGTDVAEKSGCKIAGKVESGDCLCLCYWDPFEEQWKTIADQSGLCISLTGGTDIAELISMLYDRENGKLVLSTPKDAHMVILNSQNADILADAFNTGQFEYTLTGGQESFDITVKDASGSKHFKIEIVK